MLAAVDFDSPLVWAVLIGWIMTVVLHEWAHGIVAYFGGDYTIRERGGLSMNPLQYVDPVMSIILPAVFLMMGGIPLPGGSTFIRRDLIRSRAWNTAVSLAGPAMNFLLFLLCVVAYHPRLGWIDVTVPVAQWTNLQLFVGTMAVLQFIAVVLNLIPIPPLDGFQAISEYMNEDARIKLSTPPLSTFLFLGYFVIIWQTGFIGGVLTVFDRVVGWMGFGDLGGALFGAAFYQTLWGGG